MNKLEIIEKRFDAIMELKGAEELKKECIRLETFLKNKATHFLTDLTPPNYLWIIKRGGGNTTWLKEFAEFLYSKKAIEFCGIELFIEFKLEYNSPNAFFSELTRLDKTIAAFAGHNRYYKGLICINIDDWLAHTTEEHFIKLLEYLSSNNSRLLVIFCIQTEDKNFIKSVESALSSHMRLVSLSLRFPDAKELVELVESRYIQKTGFSFTESAKKSFQDTIKELITCKNFNGFKSVFQLADAVLYDILASDLREKKQISAEMLSNYSKDSDYVKLLKNKIDTKTIGFTNERGN
jgi:hypothetical protein